MSETEDKKLYVIAGCNGAGKTTASFTILPGILDCREFVNADEIARGVSPFQPEKAAFEAGRIMLRRIEMLMGERASFAFETTLSTKSYKNTILEARSIGYNVTLLYFWLESVALAKERVNIRVSEGGHNIAPEIIERRYMRGIENLFDIYLPIVDAALVFDNSFGDYQLIADKRLNEGLNIFRQEQFQKMKQFYDEH
ncbi:MAG: zeta toxin family protein [Bacteroidetes bacterium]|nr:zeta toxin family protein [Bacteroidota bacterium]